VGVALRRLTWRQHVQPAAGERCRPRRTSCAKSQAPARTMEDEHLPVQRESS